MSNQMPAMGEPWVETSAERPLLERIDDSQNGLESALARIEDELDRLENRIVHTAKSGCTGAATADNTKPVVTITSVSDRNYGLSLAADNLASRLHRLIERL